ncbi:hypothetical protein FNO01nite_19440 [Flavobacterium noncentrifugens]|uniref:NUMOD4 motif-containing protein n=1 Tax=Flavobacterium noncentrifugens TaxID=1128970 RepID=A0A1G8YLT1_9FLAO|nr:hypothetical protein [Flavobacterium noncentrifugens]GEP51272.1 hypothetical protein FNO01nite_19440 [Flavobacterium noncentrifugens]SDK03643.1 NUMOD4 motif-containing protein [Flavobacterium noncentrifugens]
MIRFYPNEEFKEFLIPYPLKYRYAVSNRGRLVSFTDEIRQGNLLNGSKMGGYNAFRYKIRENGKVRDKHFFIFRLVAELFIPKHSDEQTYVLHLDYVKDNDHTNNLKWATYAEMLAHGYKNPTMAENRRKLKEFKLKSDGAKLTVTKVIHLKKLLKDPNRKTRLKMLAKQFGVSEMQISRIKSGENWARVVV